ncbi:hypothetical protein QC762_0071560 [Podospora pseudocomata]|uniref:Uncharacterized protein n=1 Tax=Podospora pseudocomata TaxID=2093779 RepID=A0ABR0GGZ4_9PEZI|nr:hypothetical protein QC762_0071560 [Podospora pseudocomata]
MCEGTIYDFWCPCIFHAPSTSFYLQFDIHPPDFNYTFTRRPTTNPLKAHLSKSSHSIVYSQHCAAYKFCDDYLHSGGFNPGDVLDMGGLCPAGHQVTYEREAFISSRLCDACISGGCEENMEFAGVRTVRRSRYGWRSREEEREGRKRSRSRRGRGVSPAGSVRSFDSTGRGRSPSVGSTGTVKGRDMGVKKRGEAGEGEGKTLGAMDVKSLVDKMVQTVSALRIGGGAERQDQPRVMPASDLEAMAEESMPTPLPSRHKPSGKNLEDMFDNSGRPEYDSDQDTVVGASKTTENKSKVNGKTIAADEVSGVMQETPTDRSKSRKRRMWTDPRTDEEASRVLRFLRRGKGAAPVETGNSRERSRGQGYERITIE